MDETKRFIIDTIYNSRGLNRYSKDLTKARTVAKSFGIALSKQAKILEQTTATSFNKQGQAVVRTTAIMQDHGKKVRVVYDKVAGATKNVNASFTRFQGGLAKTGGELKKLVMRAGLVIPVWLVLRGAVMAVLQTIKSLIKEFLDLEKGMRKVMAVSRATAETQSKIYKELETEARRYFATSSLGFKEITEAMYQLGTAGRSTEEILEGFEHVLNLAIGTFGNVAMAGKTVTGILNVFENQLKSVGNTEAQVQRVTDLLAFAWQNNQIELNEMNVAMSYLADVGGLLNLSIEEVITAQSVMNNRMLRGGKGARSLAQALVKVAQDAGKLKGLGVIFDESKPLDFQDVMQQLVDIYGDQEGSLENLRELTDVFGRRGTRAIANLIQNWDQFNDRINRSTENIRGLAKELKESAEKTWPELIKKLWRQQIISRDMAGDISPLKQLLIDITAEADKGGEVVADLRKNWAKVGDQISLSKQEAMLLAKTLDLLGAKKFAQQIGEQFKFTREELERIQGAGIEFLSPSVQKAIADLLANILQITENLTREISNQTDEQKKQEKIIVKLSAGEKEKYKNVLLLARAKASEQFTTKELLELEQRLVEQTKFALGDHKKLIKLKEISNKLSVDEVKQQAKSKDIEEAIVQKLLTNELNLLKAQGASELQIIKTRIESEKKLGIEKKGLEYLNQQFALQQAITKETQKTRQERQADLRAAIIQRRKEEIESDPFRQTQFQAHERRMEAQAREAGLTQEEINKILRPTEGLKADLPKSMQDLTVENGVLSTSMISLQTAIEDLTKEIIGYELRPDPTLPDLKNLLTQAIGQPQIISEEQKVREPFPTITTGQQIGGGINRLIEIKIGDTQLYVNTDIDRTAIERLVTEQLDVQNEQRKTAIISEIASQIKDSNSLPGKATREVFNSE